MRKKKSQPKPQLQETVRISEKVVLNKGDRIRVSAGPYYLGKNGEKINMGERGDFIFSHAIQDGIYATSVKDRKLAFIYTGVEKISPVTGLHMRPHKIVKRRKKKG